MPEGFNSFLKEPMTSGNATGCITAQRAELRRAVLRLWPSNRKNKLEYLRDRHFVLLPHGSTESEPGLTTGVDVLLRYPSA